MNGRNGSLYDLYTKRRTDWALILSLCTVILALLTIGYYTLRYQTRLEIENTSLKLRNEIQKQILEKPKYVPDRPFVGD